MALIFNFLFKCDSPGTFQSEIFINFKKFITFKVLLKETLAGNLMLKINSYYRSSQTLRLL